MSVFRHTVTVDVPVTIRRATTGRRPHEWAVAVAGLGTVGHVIEHIDGDPDDPYNVGYAALTTDGREVAPQPDDAITDGLGYAHRATAVRRLVHHAMAVATCEGATP